MLLKCLTAYIEMNSDLTGTFYHVLTSRNICITVVRKSLFGFIKNSKISVHFFARIAKIFNWI